jgi:hypothetical protein
MTMSEQLRLIEIAHTAAVGSPVQRAALDLLMKAASPPIKAVPMEGTVR